MPSHACAPQAHYLLRTARNGARMGAAVREDLMDLKDFVSQTLCQIIEGVKDAQSKASEHGGNINPRFARGSPERFSDHGLMHLHSGGFAQFVQFDVALTATSGTGTKGGVGVVAGIF